MVVQLQPEAPVVGKPGVEDIVLQVLFVLLAVDGVAVNTELRLYNLYAKFIHLQFFYTMQ